MFESVVVTGSTVSRVNVVGSNVGVASMTVFSGATSLLTGNTLYVDSVNGHDTGPDAGVRGDASKPFLTLVAAQTPSQSGDLIEGCPGSYSTTVLGKDGINWNFPPGVTITADGDATSGVFSDAAGAMTYSVVGHADLICVGTGQGSNIACVMIDKPGSDVRIEAKLISVQATGIGDVTAAALQCSDGKLWVDADIVEAGGSGDSYGVWWIGAGGDMRVRGRRIIADHDGDGGAAVRGSISSTATGDLYIDVEEILSTSTDGSTPAILLESTDAAAKAWIMGTPLISALSGATLIVNGGKVYFIGAAKIVGNPTSFGVGFAVVHVANGLVWFESEKITGTYGTALEVTGGTARVTLQQIEDLGHLTQAISVTGGVLELEGAVIVLAEGNGLNISGGTCYLKRCRIDTSAVATGNPIVISGGTLTLDNCTLIANAARNAIEAGTAQNVAVGGTLTTNRPNHANVTLTGGLFVRSDSATPPNVVGMGSIGFESTATITNGTWSFYALAAGTFANMRAATATGTCTANVKINGVNVTGWSAVSVTNSAANTAATAANSVAQGDLITITISSASGTGATISLRGTRP